METLNKKNHWENIYATKQPNEVSWTQEIPHTSLRFIHSAKLNKQARIIDIGGGDSKLADFLLDEGFENVSVLDISEEALARAKKRLGEKAARVTWIVSDITDFEPTQTYNFWHDRAAFHFLTTENQIAKYLSVARKAVKENGIVTIGTFSENGPKKCSGLEIKQYSETSLTSALATGFEKIKCITENHTTPFDTTQNFLFCSFRRVKKYN
ncbi:MAG: class I SAM-dependent methyltransferase [Chitinophagaceae bacterium]|jgi:ubiquinone/menaquinone biosynthesis C-methylase UbiE|nr:class I SAM-dependent methyltransferase [Chitinophagaceae bacterium]